MEVQQFPVVSMRISVIPTELAGFINVMSQRRCLAEPFLLDGARSPPPPLGVVLALMRKLGLAATKHVKSKDFSSYITLFHDRLTEVQAKIIDELFMDKTSALAGGDLEEAV
jgi:hypothetical protein